MSDATTKVPSYRRKDTSILPLPAFMTLEIPDQVERLAEDRIAGRAPRTFDDWERDTSANMNRMATDGEYRRQVAAWQS